MLLEPYLGSFPSICIYMYIYEEIDSKNPTRCEKINGNADKPKQRQRIQINILSLFPEEVFDEIKTKY